MALEGMGSVDALLEGLPESVQRAVKALVESALKVQQDVPSDDAERVTVMQGVAVDIRSVANNLDAEARTTLKAAKDLLARLQAKELLAEGYKMLQEDVGADGELVISWNIADGHGEVKLSMKEIADLAGSGKVEMRIAGRDGVEGLGVFNLLTQDGAAVMAMVDHDERVVTLLFEAGNLPNAPEARRLIAKEFESAATESQSPVKYKPVGKFRVAELMSEVTNGNISVVRKPFGDEHPRGSEVLRLSTVDGTNFNCLLTLDGEDVKIEIYFPRG